MKTPIALSVAAVFSVGFLGSATAQAEGFKDIQKALANGNTDLSIRYRFENVDQDNINKKANASTVLTRLSYKSADVNGFFTVLEVDNVTSIGNENYNSTANGKGQYPVVADPTDTDLNQAYIGYKTGGLILSAGRQRINHNDQRFVGGVAWRQNEQTYDGYRAQYKSGNGLNVDYSYVYNVNRIFGPTGEKSDLAGNLHLLNVNYAVNKQHKIAGYVYDLDFDTANGLATRTIGASYDGQLSVIKVHAAYAAQSETGNNLIDFSVDYLNLEVATQISAINLGVGYESLGSDNGIGFSTPLATLHKFQGFTDKFLGTPSTGVNDLYIKTSGKIGKLALAATYHQLDSDVDSIDYGTEINLVAKYPLADKVGLLIKYANYSADDFSVDTSKLWGMVTFKF